MTRIMLRLTIAAFISALSLGTAAAEEPPRVTVKLEAPALAEKLCGQLGAPEFAKREAAEKSLRALGNAAVPAVRRATRADDPEVRIRAMSLLDELVYGVTDEWPDDYRQNMERYSTLDDFEQEGFLLELAMELGTPAAAFLVKRGIEGDELEKRVVPEALRHIVDPAAGTVALKTLGSADGETATRIRAWALDTVGRPLDSYVMLAELKIPDPPDAELEQHVRELLQLIREGRNTEATTISRKLRETYPESLRMIYLQAEATERNERPDAADRLRAQALKMHGDVKRPHWLAGVMLSGMGRRRLAEAEWRAVISVEPKQDPYTIYAMLRLARDSARGGSFAQAADLLDDCLQTLIQMRDSQHPMGVLGVAVSSVNKTASGLRAQAESTGERTLATPMQDALAPNALEIAIEPLPAVPEQMEEYARNVADTHLVVAVTGSAPGTAMKQLEPGLSRDVAAGTARVTLLGVPASPPFPLPPADGDLRIMLDGDGWVRFLSFAEGAETAESTGDFALRFRLSVLPATAMDGYTDVTVNVDGKNHEMTDLQDGVILDSLPEVLSLFVKGKAPSGRWNTTHLALESRALVRHTAR